MGHAIIWTNHANTDRDREAIKALVPKRWRPSGDFKDARDQLNDWRSWFTRDGNETIFRERFLFLSDKYEDRPLEPQCVLIYGRESEFHHGGGHTDPRALRYKRDQQRGANESFMTFDALRPRYDHGNSMTLTMTACGPKIHAFSPVASKIGCK